MCRKERQKVGIMGGTFNPIHMGHLILAENAYKKFGLDKVLIMPLGEPPHKEDETIAASNHRVAMVELAIEDYVPFELSLMEVKRKGTTYTYETLQLLKKENPDTEYYFILGADSLFAFEKWKNPKLICEYCTLLVAQRADLITEELSKQVHYLGDKYNAKIHYLDTPNMNISSEMIRNSIAVDKPITYYLPKKVETYIYENRLYGSRQTANDGTIDYKKDKIRGC